MFGRAPFREKDRIEKMRRMMAQIEYYQVLTSLELSRNDYEEERGRRRWRLW